MEPTQKMLESGNIAPHFKTKLIRGQTGGYGWEITVYGATTKAESDCLYDEAVNAVSEAIRKADQNIFYPDKKK